MISYIFFIILLIFALVNARMIALSDWRTRTIPDVYLFPLMLTGLIIVLWYPWVIDINTAVIGAVFGYALSFFTGYIYYYFFSRRVSKENTPIGMGDLKLIATGGLWLGPNGLAITLILTCLGGYLWGRREKQKFIPFGTFFIPSAILTLIVLFFLI